MLKRKCVSSMAMKTTLILIVGLAFGSISVAEVPMIITYQGILSDSGTPVDGTHSVVFALYDAESDGTLLWDETQTVSFNEGYFTVELGSVDSLNLDFSQEYWLGIAIDEGAELDPRTPTTSSAFAIRAKYVDKLTEANIHEFWAMMQTMDDADGDGYNKISAGGDDCDDWNPYINPDAIELCDGIDNNCDGQTDNGAESDCLPLPANVAQVGCVAGECVITACSEGYTDENGIFEDGCESDCIQVYNDSDCDGWITNPPPEPVCENEAGPCYEYVVTANIGDCDDGDPDINPDAPELCNEIDDDCDGQTDENWPELGQPCDGEDSDLCENGFWTCSSDGMGLDCYESVQNIQETCNGIDDDCDGETDEGLIAPPCESQAGVCGGAVKRCGGASGWLPCDETDYGPDYEPVEVTCDGLDNDCDGQTDEGGICISEGDLIFTEIMQDPSVLPDADGEWFEIYNTTGSTIDLDGVSFHDLTSSFTVNEYLPISPGGYLTFATSNHEGLGFEPDYNFNGDISLNNGDETLEIWLGTTMVDQVSYDDGVTFPDPTGASMNLDSGSFDHVSNDNGANWCESVNSYNGDLGTPGSANVSCGR